MKLARVEGLRPKRGTQVNYLELVWDASRPQFVLEPGSIGESREARAVEETMLKLRMEMTEPTTVSHEAENDFRSILGQIDAEPVEDGKSHPAEAAMTSFAEAHGTAALLAFAVCLWPPVGDSRKAALLRLLGRHRLLTARERKALLVSGLASDDVEVRDAAAQAAELWEDFATAGLLRAHSEKVPWLAAYIEQVAKSIGG